MNGEHRSNSNTLTLGSIEAHYNILTHDNALNLQITKSQLRTLCDRLQERIAKPKYKDNVTKKELEEMSNYISNEINKVLLDPLLTDYMMAQCLFAVDKEKLLCKVLVLVPDIVINLNKIKNFSVSINALSLKLSKDKSFQTGFITLDREGRVVALHQSDPKFKVYAIIGIWVSGLSSVNAQYKNFLVIGALLRFLFMEDIKLRTASQSKGLKTSYLLVDFSESSIQFFEFRLKKRDNSWILLESSHEVIMREECKEIKIQLDNKHCRSYKFSQIIPLSNKVRSHSQRHDSKHNTISSKTIIADTQRFKENKHEVTKGKNVTACKFQINSIRGPIKILKIRDSLQNTKNIKDFSSSNASQCNINEIYKSPPNKSGITSRESGSTQCTGGLSGVKSAESGGLSSAGKSAPYLGRIVLEQQKQIQKLQQQLSSLAKIMQEMTNKERNCFVTDLEDIEKLLNNKVRGRNIGESKTCQNTSKPIDNKYKLTLSPEDTEVTKESLRRVKVKGAESFFRKSPDKMINLKEYQKISIIPASELSIKIMSRNTKNNTIKQPVKPILFKKESYCSRTIASVINKADSSKGGENKEEISKNIQRIY